MSSQLIADSNLLALLTALQQLQNHRNYTERSATRAIAFEEASVSTGVFPNAIELEVAKLDTSESKSFCEVTGTADGGLK